MVIKMKRLILLILLTLWAPTAFAAGPPSTPFGSGGTTNPWIIGATSVLTLAYPIVLNQATGNEYAQSLFYQTKKSGSGDDTGQIISMRDTASPGTSYLFRAGINTDGTIGTHSDRYNISNSGVANFNTAATTGIRLNDGSAGIIGFYHSADRKSYIYGDSGSNIELGPMADFNIVLRGSKKVSLSYSTANTETVGQFYSLLISKTYNQASGTAANTDLLINRTETAVGSGAQKFIEAQVATVPKFTVWNTGGVTIGKYTTDPCPTIGEGSIFYNDTSDYMCYCNASADVKMSDDTTACF